MLVGLAVEASYRPTVVLLAATISNCSATILAAALALATTPATTLATILATTLATSPPDGGFGLVQALLGNFVAEGSQTLRGVLDAAPLASLVLQRKRADFVQRCMILLLWVEEPVADLVLEVGLRFATEGGVQLKITLAVHVSAQQSHNHLVDEEVMARVVAETDDGEFISILRVIISILPHIDEEGRHTIPYAEDVFLLDVLQMESASVLDSPVRLLIHVSLRL